MSASTHNDAEILLSLIKEHLSEIRHTEKHRQMIINMILALATASTAVFSIKPEGIAGLLLPLLTIFLGIFGIVVVKKLYERQVWYQDRRDTLIEKLDAISNTDIIKVYKEHENTHKESFSLLSKLRMNFLWSIINMFVVFIGLCMLLINITLT